MFLFESSDIKGLKMPCFYAKKCQDFGEVFLYKISSLTNNMLMELEMNPHKK